MVKLNLQLPEHFLDAETRDGYYISPEMKKVWAVELDLLNEFMRICKEYDLRWFADAGTLLGAVRHGGFIPWDDDIDIMMLREDYEKFCEVANNELKHPYFLHDDRREYTRVLGHAQLRNSNTTAILKGHVNRKFEFNQGIFIDIFPLDNMPSDEKEQDKLIWEVNSSRQNCSVVCSTTMMYSPKWQCGFYSGFRHWAKHILYTILRKDKEYPILVKTFHRSMQVYNNKETKYVAKLMMNDIKKYRIWDKKWLQDIVYFPFEMFQIPIPAEYVKILNMRYGDWHTFKKGTSVHGEVLFDAEKSYTEYTKY